MVWIVIITFGIKLLALTKSMESQFVLSFWSFPLPTIYNIESVFGSTEGAIAIVEASFFLYHRCEVAPHFNADAMAIEFSGHFHGGSRSGKRVQNRSALETKQLYQSVRNLFGKTGNFPFIVRLPKAIIDFPMVQVPMIPAHFPWV